MKQFLSLLLVFALLLSGCSQNAPSQPAESSAIPEESASLSTEMPESTPFICEYSNLTTEASRQETADILREAGVSEERIKVFLDHVEQFNSTVDASLLVGAFETRDILSPAYDPYEYQDEWLEQYPDFNGYNCRITAFGLFGDLISAAPDAEVRDSDLFMDMESLDADPSVLLNDGDADTFRRVFSTVPTENTANQELHREAIQKDWEERGISIDNDASLSLVTVWFHNQWSETENELFIGHVGVLAETEKGVYFVEKIAFQEPYQVLKLENRQQLEEYLLARYGVQWGQETAQPFVVFS